MKHKTRLAATALLTIAVTTMYEATKQALVPSLTVWQSHLITICVVSGVVTGLLHALSRRARQLESAADAANAALERSEASLLAFVNALPEPAFLIDRQMQCMAVNEAMAQRFDLKPPDLVGRDLFSFLPDRAVAEARVARLEEVFRSGKPVTFIDARRDRHYANHIFPAVDSSGYCWAVAGVAIEITEMKKAEQLLREREELLRLGFEAVRMGAWEWDPVSNLLTISSEMVRFASFAPPATSGPYELYRTLIHPDDRERVERSRLDCAAGRTPLHNVRFRVVDPATHKSTWCEVWARMFDGPNGSRRMVGTLLDIQASVEAEERQQDALEQMRVSEERYRMLVESAAETVLVVDAESGRLIDANKTAEQFLGIERERLLASDLGVLSPSLKLGSGSLSRLSFEKAAGGEPQAFEWPCQHASGGEYVAELRLSRMPTTAGRRLIRLAATDVTRRRHSERALQEVMQATAGHTGQPFFDSLVAGLAKALGVEYVLVGRLAPDGQSARTLAVWAGAPAANIDYELTHSPCSVGAGRATCVYPRGVQQAFPDDALLRQIDADSYLGVPLMSATGEQLGLIVALDKQPMEDTQTVQYLLAISAVRCVAELERLRAEAEIVRVNDQLERRVEERTLALTSANQELESFCYSVSHDLRAPLRSIDGFSLALLEDYTDRLDAQGNEWLETVRSETQRMGQLIDDLLSLSRVTRSVMNRGVINLSELAEEVVSAQRRRDPARRAEVTIARDLFAVGDAGLLRIVLDNLIANAWKFTRSSSLARIELGEAYLEEKRAFFVRDNGVGFAMEHARKLFEPFQRLHSPSDFEGTGVGLATVNRIIRRHGGKVWAQSKTNQGATFFWTLPEGARESA